MLIAQISDLHMRRDEAPLNGMINARAYIQEAIDTVEMWKPDAVLVTGDLTDTGAADDYATLADILSRLTAPCYVTPGNHDLHAPMLDAFSDHRYLPKAAPLNWIAELGPVRLIGLDSVVPGAAHGALSSDTLGWLDAQLAASEAPTLVALHHPPFETGLPGLDEIKCLNGEDLGAIIKRHPHVERVLTGHYHRTLQVRWAGTLGQIAPAVVHQTDLASARRGAAAWVMEPRAILLHDWQEHTGLITHTAYIGDFGAPQPFGSDDI